MKRDIEKTIQETKGKRGNYELTYREWIELCSMGTGGICCLFPFFMDEKKRYSLWGWLGVGRRKPDVFVNRSKK